MKWYNYGDQWVNMEHVSIVSFTDKEVVDKEYAHKNRLFIRLRMNTAIDVNIEFKSYEERATELEKIKQIMGVKDYTSRCC